MNKLEMAISAAVARAYRDYCDITNNWLYHAPEHYLQNAILLQLGKRSAFSVYAEATRKKIAEGQEIRPRGRPPAVNIRHDLTIWAKSSNDVRAVLEIKRAMDLNAKVRADFQRVSKAVRGRSRHAPRTGYVLIYSEAKHEATLRTRFSKWADDMGYLLVNGKTCVLVDDTADSGWACGFGLFRYQ